MARLIWPRSSVKSESKSTSESNDITSASSPLRRTRSMKRLPASWIEPSMYCSLPDVSSNMARVMGRVTSLEKKAICCGWLSSATLKSSCFRSVTMRLLLSRTVTNKLTRLTCVRITGGCCDGSWDSAWRVVPAANAKATQTTRTFIAERMYNFLVQDTRSEGPAASLLTPRYDAGKLGAGCVAQPTGAAGNRRKFGLRTMKSLRKIVFAAIAVLAGFAVYLEGQTAGQSAPSAGSTQNSSPQPPQRPPAGPPPSEARAKISVNSNLVILPVTVKDRSGNLVPDLRRDEFRVFEDHVEQNIDVFTAEAFPLSMIILLDNDLKDKDAKQVSTSLEAIVGGMSLDDEAFVCRVDQFFHPGKGFTGDRDALLTELQRTKLDTEPSTSPPGGAIANAPSINGHSAIGDAPNMASATMNIRGQTTKAVDDAVFGAAQLLRDRPRTRRKLILLISDGANGGKKTNTMNYDTVVKTLQHDNIAVYSVAVASAFLERKFSRLVDYAHDSGGDVYFAAKRETLEELYSRISEEARNVYTLAYVPRRTDRSAEFHHPED